MKAFKLFFVDVGLLSCMGNLDFGILLEGNELFKEFKGALTEQYVLQSLKTMSNLPCYYWTSDSGKAEVDFLLQDAGRIIPMEVKAELNLQSKSLKSYREKFHPTLALRTSLADFRSEAGLIDLPLYAVEMLKDVIHEKQ